LTSSGQVSNVRTLYTNNYEQGMIYSPTVFDPGSGPRVLFTISTINPVIAHIPFTPNSPSFGNARGVEPNPMPSQKIDLDGFGGDTGSGSYDDNFANVSPNGRRVILPRIDRPAGDVRYA